MENAEVKKEMDRFGKYLVQQSRSNLSRYGHKDSGKLYDSLSYDLTVYPNSGALEFYFNMEEYGSFQDQGVRGKFSSQKAPNSPYRFGSGTGKKGGLTEAIQGWVQRKRFQFRKTNGKFMSYSDTAFTIIRSIYNTGLRPTEFFTRPFELGFNKLSDDLVKAYGLDFEKFMNFSKKK